MATKKKTTKRKPAAAKKPAVKKPVVKAKAAPKPPPVEKVAKRLPSVPPNYDVCPYPSCGSTKIRVFQIKGGQAIKHQCAACRRFLEGAV